MERRGGLSIALKKTAILAPLKIDYVGLFVNAPFKVGLSSPARRTRKGERKHVVENYERERHWWEQSIESKEKCYFLVI